MPRYISDSEDEMPAAVPTKLFRTRQRPMHALLGGGKVADVLLWKKSKMSGALMIGTTLIWLLFEVAEYNLVTLISHISITCMLLFFIWSTAADFLNWKPPQIPEIVLQEHTFREAASAFHKRFNYALTLFLDIACGRQPRLFFLVCMHFTCLIFRLLTCVFIETGYVALQTLPFLYERYEEEVDYFAGTLMRDARRAYKKFDSKVLNKIPRGPVNDKKAR
ncbi:Reticulon-like protein B9 [Linum perenne]